MVTSELLSKSASVEKFEMQNLKWLLVQIDCYVLHNLNVLHNNI